MRKEESVTRHERKTERQAGSKKNKKQKGKGGEQSKVGEGEEKVEEVKDEQPEAGPSKPVCST